MNPTCQHHDPRLPSPQTVRNPRLLPKLPVHGITNYHDNTSGLLELSKMHTKHFKKRGQFLLQHKSMTAGEKARQSVPLLPREDSGGCVFCDGSRAAPTPAFQAPGLQGPHTPQHGPAAPAAASSQAAWAGSSHYLATSANSVGGGGDEDTPQPVLQTEWKEKTRGEKSLYFYSFATTPFLLKS